MPLHVAIIKPTWSITPEMISFLSWPVVAHMSCYLYEFACIICLKIGIYHECFPGYLHIYLVYDVFQIYMEALKDIDITFISL